MRTRSNIPLLTEGVVHSKGKSSKRCAWTREEDEIVTSLITSANAAHWNWVADQLRKLLGSSNRTGKQCRERWHNHLNPNISKQPWNIEEELVLFEIHSQIGNKWAEIAALLPMRPDNAVKNRYYSTLKRCYRKLHNCEANQREIRKCEKDLCSVVLKNLHKKDKKRKNFSFENARGAFFQDSLEHEQNVQPPDLPKILPMEVSSLLVTGHSLFIPYYAPQPLPEEEFDVVFQPSDRPSEANEVLILPVNLIQS